MRGKQPVLTTTYEKTGKVQRDSYYYPNRKKKRDEILRSARKTNQNCNAEWHAIIKTGGRKGGRLKFKA